MIPAKYRKAVYIGAVALAVAAFAAGVVTPEQVNAGVDTASQVVGLLAAVLALLNVSPDVTAADMDDFEGTD